MHTTMHTTRALSLAMDLRQGVGIVYRKVARILELFLGIYVCAGALIRAAHRIATGSRSARRPEQARPPRREGRWQCSWVSFKGRPYRDLSLGITTPTGPDSRMRW